MLAGVLERGLRVAHGVAGPERQVAHLTDEDHDDEHDVHRVGPHDPTGRVDRIEGRRRIGRRLAGQLRSARPARGARTPSGGARRDSRFMRELPDLARPPELQKERKASHRDQGGEDVRQLRSDEVRDKELDDCERDAGHEDRRQDLSHPAPTGENNDQVGRDQDGEEWELPADHGRQGEGRLRRILVDDRRDEAAERHDRDADRPKGNRCGVGQQRQHGRGYRFEAEARQDRGADRHRRAEPGDALEQGAKAECDQESLEAAVLSEAGERAFDDVEVPAGDSQVVEHDRVEHDPADRPEPKGHAFGGGSDRDTGRHAPRDHSQQRGDRERGQRADPCRQAEDRQHDEEHIKRQAGDKG